MLLDLAAMISPAAARRSMLPSALILAVLISLTPFAATASGTITTHVPSIAESGEPRGERLRVLAAAHDLEIGYAARLNWHDLDVADQYNALAAAEFNSVTPEASLKWLYLQPLQGDFDYVEMDRQLESADTAGQAIHGHTLTWYTQLPEWLQMLPASEVQDELENHIAEVVGHYADRIDIWDVVNEALVDFPTGAEDIRDNVFYQAMGVDYIDVAFRAARAADPDVELLYNDFGIGWINDKSDAMIGMLEPLRSAGMPIDGIGMQMHIDHTFDQAEGFSSNMQRLADLGYRLHVTEFDVGIVDTQTHLLPTLYGEQAAQYQDILERCLMQPECKSFTLWGNNDQYSWRPYHVPLPFGDEFEIKPAYYAMQNALSGLAIHPERCNTDAANVASGAVQLIADDSSDASGAAVICPLIALGDGFTDVRVRYANGGLDTPSLTIRSSDGTVLATVDLPPVEQTEQGRFATLAVPLLAPGSGFTDLSLHLDGPASATDVELDALLLRGPLNSDDSFNAADDADSENPDTNTGGSTSGRSGGGGAIVWFLPVLALAALMRRLNLIHRDRIVRTAVPPRQELKGRQMLRVASAPAGHRRRRSDQRLARRPSGS